MPPMKNWNRAEDSAKMLERVIIGYNKSGFPTSLLKEERGYSKQDLARLRSFVNKTFKPGEARTKKWVRKKFGSKTLVQIFGTHVERVTEGNDHKVIYAPFDGYLHEGTLSVIRFYAEKIKKLRKVGLKVEQIKNKVIFNFQEPPI